MVTVTVTTTMRVVGGLLPMLARLFFRFSNRIDEFVSDTTVFNLGLGLSTYRATFDVHVVITGHKVSIECLAIFQFNELQGKLGECVQ